jgi:SulP family sulfate permease
VIGLVLAVVLFAINYGRTELIHEVALGPTYHSNVDRSPGERDALRALGPRVQILRVSGYVFFGMVSGLLERVRLRVDDGPLRYLVLDLRRATGIDSSAVLAVRKVAQIAEASGFELVLTDVPEPVMTQLELGGVVAVDGVVRFEPDLDRGLQVCEDGLLGDASGVADEPGVALAGMPAGLSVYASRESLAAGAVLIHQDEPPDDVFVLESGRLQVEMVTPEGTRMRLRTVLPGVVVGEIALYTGIPRTADVVAETASVVLRLSRTSIEQMERAEPELAAALHRWLATTVSERLTDTLRAFDALLD